MELLLTEITGVDVVLRMLFSIAVHQVLVELADVDTDFRGDVDSVAVFLVLREGSRVEF